MFRHHRCPKAIILQAVYFKLRFPINEERAEDVSTEIFQ